MDRYEVYKDSGVEWIGGVPESWQFGRLKQRNTIAGRIGWQGLTSDEYCDEGPYLITGVNFNEGIIDWDSCVHITDERWAEASQIQIEDGDLLITKDGTVGKVAFAANLQERASLNSGVMVIRPTTSEQNMRYLFWVLQSEEFWGWFADINSGNSTIIHLYQGDFLNFGYYLPPMLEQNAIADYLDVKTAEIDALVTDCEREVELLRECRKAVISEAVTKGLDPDAPMKGSGVEWIGEIPEEWNSEKTKFNLAFINGRAYKQEELLGEGKYRVLRVGNFNTNDNWYYSDLELDEKQYCERGDLLYLWATTFGPQFWDGEKVIYHYHIWKVVCGNAITKEYAYYALDAQASWQELQSHGSTMVHVTKEGMEQSSLPIPPLEEQRAIVEHLNKKTAEIDSLIEAKRQMADKLREYRKSLISEAVTGKFKVPGVE